MRRSRAAVQSASRKSGKYVCEKDALKLLNRVHFLLGEAIPLRREMHEDRPALTARSGSSVRGAGLVESALAGGGELVAVLNETADGPLARRRVGAELLEVGPARLTQPAAATRRR